MKTGKKGKLALGVAAVIVSLAELTLAVGLHFSYKEMQHERLTYSQWYDGALASFFDILLLFIVSTALCAGLWYFFIRRPRPLSPEKIKSRKRVLPFLCAALGGTAIWFTVKSFLAYGELLYAQEQVFEGIPGYILAYNAARLPALLAVLGLIIALIALVSARKNETKTL